MVAKITALFFIVFFLHFSANSQEGRTRRISLSGRVVESGTGMPLPGASVYLAEDRVGVTADSLGAFTVVHLPPGHHVVEITHTGYGTLVEHLELASDTLIVFQLSSVIIENQGVIVTGVSGATSIRKAPVPVSSIRRAELLQSVSTNIIDALSNVPGVSQLSTGPAISKPFIRGLGFNRVVVVNEGVRQEGQQWGDEHGIEIDETSVLRAEVLKGPASLMYGSDAIAGVIHLISNTPVSQGTILGNIISNYQSNGGLISNHANLAGNRNGFNWNIYGSMKSAGDYRNRYDGRVLNSRFREMNAGGYLGVNRSWGYSHLIYSRYHQEAGLIEGDRDPGSGRFLLYAGTPDERVATDDDLTSRKPLAPFLDVTHHKVVSDNNIVMGRSRLKINLAYQQNLRKEIEGPAAFDVPELFFDLQTVNYNFQWQLPAMKEWHSTVGINGMKQWNQNRGEEALIPAYDLFDAGVFVFFQRFFERSTLSGGLRFDTRDLQTDELQEGGDLKFEALSRRFSSFSGSLGLSRDLSEKATLRLNLARGFRAPTVAELSSNGAHEGSNRYEYGNAQLKAENSLQADAGIEMNFEHVNFGLSLFYNNINDFIFYRKLQSMNGGDSLVDVDGDLVPAFRFNQQDASLHGFELNVDLHPHPLDWLHFENTISFVRGRFAEAIDGSRHLPLIPAPRIRSELRGDFKKAGGVFQNLYAKLDLDWSLSQDQPFTGFDTETATGAYALLHFGAGAEIISKNRKTPLFLLHLGVLNLADVAYQSHLSRLKYTDINLVTGRPGVFNAGRNFSLRVQVPLRFSR